MRDTSNTDSVRTDSLRGDSLPLPVAGREEDVPSAVFFHPGRPAPAGAADTSALPFFRLEDLQMASIQGISGEYPPYSLGTDDGFVAVLLLSTFFAVGTTVRSWRHICGLFGALFRSPFGEYERCERGGEETCRFLFFVFQAAFVLGTLFFDYTQEFLPDAFGDVPPQMLMVVDVAGCFVFFLLKFLFYRVVNGVFFDRSKTAQWFEAYFLSLFSSGLLLLPVVLMTIYFGWPPRVWIVFLVSVFLVIGLLLLFRCFRIFFRAGLGYVHLILYFCAFEIVPAFMLWRFLLWINLNLTIIF